MRFLACAAVSIFLAGCAEEAPSTVGGLAGAKASITGKAVFEHMRKLASDEMEGREAGTHSYARAASYVADEFRDAGLEPFGDDGTYFQSVRLFESRLVPGSARLIVRKSGEDIELTFGEDFVRRGGFGDAHEDVSADLVFVGFGITAPEYDHDDFTGIDVAGKILVELTGAPPHFATDERAYYSSGSTKAATAAQRGAIGIISVRTPVDQRRLPWAGYLAAVGSPEMRWADLDGALHGGGPELPGSAVLSESGASRLFDLAGRSLDEIFSMFAVDGVESFDLGISARMIRDSTQKLSTSPNVVGLLRGRTPVLPEYLVFTAHLDHLGIRPGIEGDNIYNGAYDNAAGVAAVIEIARAMSLLPTRPRRPVLFVALTAEEKGLLGSDYFVNHPPVPIDQIAATINIDMPYFGFPVADVHAFGVEHSTLRSELLSAAAEEGLQLTPDSKPELVRFIRSDQYSFVQKGIPGLNLKPGSMSADSAVSGENMLMEYLSRHYHQPSDDLSLPFSHEGTERFVRTALHFGVLVASGRCRPEWNVSDFFALKFAASLPNAGSNAGNSRQDGC
jgi:hypothetical protein